MCLIADVNLTFKAGMFLTLLKYETKIQNIIELYLYFIFRFNIVCVVQQWLNSISVSTPVRLSIFTAWGVVF